MENAEKWHRDAAADWATGGCVNAEDALCVLVYWANERVCV